MMTADELIALQGQITPGPWRLSRYASTLIEADNNRGIASTGGYQRNFGIDRVLLENNANAVLIVAAPDLLAEVIRLRAFLDDLATAKVETIPRRRRDPQDDEPDMMEVDTFYAWQEDARATLAGKAGA